MNPNQPQDLLMSDDTRPVIHTGPKHPPGPPMTLGRRTPGWIKVKNPDAPAATRITDGEQKQEPGPPMTLANMRLPNRLRDWARVKPSRRTCFSTQQGAK
jgi:hypothetical protein